MKNKIRNGFFILLLSLAYSITAQTYSDDSETLVNADLVKNNTITTSAALQSFGISNQKNNRSNSLQGNTIFLQQVGALNSADIFITSNASELNINQNGAENNVTLGYNVKTAIVDISQEGFRNIAFDFVNDPTANVSLELTQTGDNLFFQREGTNSVIESLQFNQTSASPSIIVKSTGN
ncbi:hypothetical protein [Dokdonia sp. R86516]|uniref:hypothetical protein n=1 Tax=Dokdonia sp. R86516 TaxID=3093856 RepID=UPI0037C75514